MESYACSGRVGPGRLGELVVALRVADRAIARAVTLAGRLAGSGVCETVEGLPLEHFLGLAARLTNADRGMLITAGEVLQTMPVTAGLFADGSLSWAQVRGIVSAAKGLRVAQRQALDVRVAATIHDPGGWRGSTPTRWCGPPTTKPSTAGPNDSTRPTSRPRVDVEGVMAVPPR